MNVGELDTLLTIQQPVNTRDPVFGSTTLTWADLGDEWARVEHLPGGEKVENEQVRATELARVRIHWRGDVRADMRLQIDDQAWRITSVTPVGRRQWLDINCER